MDIPDYIPEGDEILLGELLAGAQDFMMVAGVLSPDHFPRPEHKLIFQSMADLCERREPIDRITVANELMKNNQLERSGGLTYLVKLDDIARQTGGPECA